MIIFLTVHSWIADKKKKKWPIFSNFVLQNFRKQMYKIITMITSKKMIKKVPEIKIIGNLPPPFLS